jgi:hypothetical protein
MRVVILVTIMLVCATAQASALTAGELLNQCEQLERNWVIQGSTISLRSKPGLDIEMPAWRCYGYLQAYFNLSYVQLTNADDPTAPPLRPLMACPPTGISFTQFVRMFLQEARSHPAELHEEAFFILANLLQKNFPCAK